MDLGDNTLYAEHFAHKRIASTRIEQFTALSRQCLAFSGSLEVGGGRWGGCGGRWLAVGGAVGAAVADYQP
jgi:hypothetical protein